MSIKRVTFVSFEPTRVYIYQVQHVQIEQITTHTEGSHKPKRKRKRIRETLVVDSQHSILALAAEAIAS